VDRQHFGPDPWKAKPTLAVDGQALHGWITLAGLESFAAVADRFTLRLVDGHAGTVAEIGC